jgi:ubiquinone biosynthesis protein
VDAMLNVVFDAMEPELDFVAEARNMEQGRAAIQRFKHLSVPDVLLATPRVLVQSLAPGVSIRDADPATFTLAQRTAIGRDLLAYLYRGFFIDRYFHADPHPKHFRISRGKGVTDRLGHGRPGGPPDQHANGPHSVDAGTKRRLWMSEAWIEMGRPTPWANVPGFANDMARLIPKVVGASLADLDFGITLTAVLKSATKRGVQTSPVVAILGKAFGNIEGSIRYLAPELSLVEVFEDELQAIMFDLFRELISKQQAARTAMELIIGSTEILDQLRGLMRNLSTFDNDAPRFGTGNQ